MRRMLVVGIGMFITSALPGTAQLVNGNFEMPAMPVGSYELLVNGEQTLPGWFIGGTGGKLIHHHPTWSVSTGDESQLIQFNSGDEAPGRSISQSVNTDIGQPRRFYRAVRVP